MEKATFLAVLKDIVEGFENQAFQQAMDSAKSTKDVAKLVQLPLDVQAQAFTRNGLDASTGAVDFKNAGKEHGSSAEAAPLLQRMRIALGK